MSTFRNVIANVAGRLWTALMSLAFVPLYIRFLGIEAYGLIGFFATMLAVFSVLELGLSTTINRELARLSDDASGRSEARTLLRSLEAAYWTVSLTIAASIVIAAPWIARSWLRLNMLSPEQATQAVRLMGLVALMRWPVPLYAGALMGLGRHVVLNIIASVAATIAGGGVVLVLWLISPTPIAFFAWQAVVATLQLIFLRQASWRHLALVGHRARPQVAAFRSIFAFSAGVTGTALLSVILTQVDKILLARLLPLDQFGHYALASSIALMLTTAAAALNGALFPALVRRVALGDQRELARFYHHASELVSALIIPAGMTLALFAPELLLIYLGDAQLALQTQLLLSLFAVGNTLLALMMMPVALQFAHGWTSLTFIVNLVAVILFVPAVLWLVGWVGAPGAVIAWIVLTLGYFVIEVLVMHRRLLPEALVRWYVVDVGVPVLISVTLIGGARFLVTGLDDAVLRTTVGCLMGCVAVLLSFVLLPESRLWLQVRMRLLRGGMQAKKSDVA
jgi:O-antigen/teichoic acid export membrane protein